MIRHPHGLLWSMMSAAVLFHSPAVQAR
jgi:hypothetical protein